MIDVPPDTPVTNPTALTVATEVLPLLHVPPAVASVKEVLVPEQNSPVPVIPVTVGNGVTVIVCVAVAVPQGFVTV